MYPFDAWYDEQLSKREVHDVFRLNVRIYIVVSAADIDSIKTKQF